MEQHIKEMISNFIMNQEARMKKLEEENQALSQELTETNELFSKATMLYENKLNDFKMAVSKDLNEMSRSLEAHLTHSTELLNELERLTTRLK
ncbi:hypothetical protein [Halomonas sp. BC2]|uniref:hypothetical protein n=1 Tax=Halomonas sp. BC2 TaxID=1670449 RepID=UPI0009BDEFD2|nr:hypothetical protein [Halomonas sp. BC2]